MMKKWKGMKKENKLGFIILCFCILICLISITYAIWTQVFKGQKEQVITTGTFVLELTDESDEISLISAVPTSDSNGLKLTPYTFKLTNTGSIDANYRISLVNDEDEYIKDGCSNNKLDWSNIRYSFKLGENTEVMNYLNSNGGILATETLSSKNSINCALKLWIKSDADNSVMGKHFHGRIKIEAIQSDKELDS